MARYVSYFNVVESDLYNTFDKKTIVEASDDDGDGATDPAVIDSAIKYGDTKVNSYLFTGGYAVPVTLPLPPGTEVLFEAVIWYAIQQLTARRNMPPAEVTDKVTWFDNFFKQISSENIANKLVLPLPSSTGGLPQCTTLNQEKIFSRSRFAKGGGGLMNPDERRTLDVEGILSSDGASQT